MIKLNLQPCTPPAWAPAGHAQTLLGHLLPSPMLNNKGRRLEVPLPDGDRLVAFYLEGDSSTVVYLFHGLAGSTDSTYMHRTAALALKLGHGVIMVNHRGCGEGAGLAKAPYHSGRGEDLAAVLAYGKKLFPRSKQLAIGFSLSGNALLLLLSGRRGDVMPDFAISVNAPIDLQSSAMALKSGFNRVYDIKFYLQCRSDVLNGRSAEATHYEIPWLRTLHDFDNLYTAPAGGFKDREDYYQTCSTADWLTQIKTPTLVLSAHDDPFVDHNYYLRAKPSVSVTLHLEDFGGHMGYITKARTPLGTRRWLDYAIHEAIAAFVAK